MAHSRRSARTVLGIFTLSVVLLVTGAALAKPAPAGGDPYDAARDAEARLDYKAVLNHSSHALEVANTHERLVTIYRLLGTANALLGKNQDAVDAFTRLLAIDPDHKLPRGTSPKIMAPFREAGGYWVDRPGGLAVTPTLPREVQVGTLLPIPVKVDDPLGMASNVRVSYRIQGEVEWKKIETPMGANVTLTIPAEQIPEKKVDYVFELFFTALSQNGSELRLAGDATHPLTIAARSAERSTTTTTTTTSGGVVIVNEPPKPKKPLIKQWWLWTVVGAVVVVGVGVGAGLGYYYGRPDMSHTDFQFSARIPGM